MNRTSIKPHEAVAFDYAALSPDARQIVAQRTTEIRDRMGRAAQNIVEIGERLLAVKTQLQHGQFGEWLLSEFDWSSDTAQRMMHVAGHFKNRNLRDLKIAPSALYLLASPSTPAEIREQFIADAENGKPVTHAQVKDAIGATVTTFGDVDEDPPAADDDSDNELAAAEDERRAANKAYAANAPAAFLESLGPTAESAEPAIKSNHPEPQEWNGRTIPANVPPLNVDERVDNAATVRWSRLIRDIQGCIARIPDKATLDELSKERRKDVVQRFRTFAKQIEEAV